MSTNEECTKLHLLPPSTMSLGVDGKLILINRSRSFRIIGASRARMRELLEDYPGLANIGGLSGWTVMPHVKSYLC